MYLLGMCASSSLTLLADSALGYSTLLAASFIEYRRVGLHTYENLRIRKEAALRLLSWKPAACISAPNVAEFNPQLRCQTL